MSLKRTKGEQVKSYQLATQGMLALDRVFISCISLREKYTDQKENSEARLEYVLQKHIMKKMYF